MSTIEIIMCIATVGMFATSIITSVFQGRRQKNEVSFSFEPASKKEFEAHMAENKREHENIFHKMGGIERGAQAKLELVIKEGNDSREKLHSRINELLPKMGELSRNVEILNDKL